MAMLKVAATILGPDRNRFHTKIDRRGGHFACWPWTGARRGGGMRYGTFGVYRLRKNISPHRLALLMVKGSPPEGKSNALHSCGNPICCNPRHLRWGSQQENVDDRGREGRHWVPTGEAHGRSKLTWEQVETIRSSDRTQSDLALEFGVSQQIVSLVRRNETWKHAAGSGN